MPCKISWMITGHRNNGWPPSIPCFRYSAAGFQSLFGGRPGQQIQLEYSLSLTHESESWPGGIDGAAYQRDWKSGYGRAFWGAGSDAFLQALWVKRCCFQLRKSKR